MSSGNTLPTLGFLGTGTITTALVTAFCKDESRPYPIVVSPLYEKNAAYLKAKFPDRVSVAQSLQEVADRSQWVVIAVLPNAGEEVCTNVKFRREHKVINLMSDKLLPQIREWIGETEILVHMVPMSFVADQRGPIVLYPGVAEVIDLISPIGEVIAVPERYHAAVFAGISAFAASFFTLEDGIIAWASSLGVPEELAKVYTAAFFKALAGQGYMANRARLHELAEEMTPGGVNDMVKNYIQERGGFKQWIDSMTGVMERLAKDIPRGKV
jgi:pyrroline-5-carboxylate reductase